MENDIIYYKNDFTWVKKNNCEIYNSHINLLAVLHADINTDSFMIIPKNGSKNININLYSIPGVINVFDDKLTDENINKIIKSKPFIALTSGNIIYDMIFYVNKEEDITNPILKKEERLHTCIMNIEDKLTSVEKIKNKMNKVQGINIPDFLIRTFINLPERKEAIDNILEVYFIEPFNNTGSKLYTEKGLHLDEFLLTLIKNYPNMEITVNIVSCQHNMGKYRCDYFPFLELLNLREDIYYSDTKRVKVSDIVPGITGDEKVYLYEDLEFKNKSTNDIIVVSKEISPQFFEKLKSMETDIFKYVILIKGNEIYINPSFKNVESDLYLFQSIILNLEGEIYDSDFKNVEISDNDYFIVKLRSKIPENKIIKEKRITSKYFTGKYNKYVTEMLKGYNVLINFIKNAEKLKSQTTDTELINMLNDIINYTNKEIIIIEGQHMCKLFALYKLNNEVLSDEERTKIEQILNRFGSSFGNKFSSRLNDISDFLLTNLI